MKREWLQPSLDELNISATAGGPVWTDDADGEVWWDGEAWQEPHGSNLSGS